MRITLHDGTAMSYILSSLNMLIVIFMQDETATMSGSQAFAAAILKPLLNGAALRHSREGIRVSQSALARESRVSQPYIARWEAGQVSMPEETAIRVWQALARLDAQYKRSEILVRLELDRAVVTTQETFERG